MALTLFLYVDGLLLHTEYHSFHYIYLFIHFLPEMIFVFLYVFTVVCPKKDLPWGRRQT